MEESEILRRAQRLSAPTRRALSSGLEKALLSTRYEENPNVAGMITRKALQGYGEGLSSAISAGEREATDISRAEELMDIERARIGMQSEAYSDQADAATISGITQLGLLGLTGYDVFNRAAGTGSALTTVGSAAPAVTGGAAATTAGGVGATATELGGAGFEAYAVAPEAASTGAGTTTIGGVTGSTAGAAGVAAGAAVFAYGTYDFWSHWGEKTGLTAIEWADALKSGQFDTTGGYGGSTWNQWLDNYKKGLTTTNPTSQLSSMTGMTLNEAYEFGKEYNVPGFENLSPPTQVELERESRIAAQQWETLYGGG